MASNGLNFDQFMAPSHHNLSHFLQANLEFTQGLLGIAVSAVLNTHGFLATALNQAFALLLCLLTELQSIVVEPLRFITGFLLQSQALATDRVEILERLLAD